MKLLVDMNLSPSWVGWLAPRGFEAVHWSIIGAATAPDDEILSWARGHGFVVRALKDTAKTSSEARYCRLTRPGHSSGYCLCAGRGVSPEAARKV